MVIGVGGGGVTRGGGEAKTDLKEISNKSDQVTCNVYLHLYNYIVYKGLLAKWFRCRILCLCTTISIGREFDSLRCIFI